MIKTKNVIPGKKINFNIDKKKNKNDEMIMDDILYINSLDDILKTMNTRELNNKYLFEHLSILPPRKSNNISSKSIRRALLLYDLNYLDTNFVYVKIWRNILLEFLFVENNIYFEEEGLYPYLEEYKKLLKRICKREDVPDCEFLINVSTTFPVKKTLFNNPEEEKSFVLFSVNSVDGFSDIPLPSPFDLKRLNNTDSNTFGVILPYSVKWDAKKYDFCVGLPKENVVTEYGLQIVKYLESDNWDIHNKLDTTYKEEHSISKYKYVLVFDDIGYPQLISDFMFSGSCILKVNGFYKSWFEKDLIPWKHYVPVNTDLSNIQEIKTWCIEHEEECIEIGLNARHFAIMKLNSNSISDYILQILRNNSPGVKYYNTLSDIFLNLKIQELATIQKTIFPQINTNNIKNLNISYLTFNRKRNWAQNMVIQMLYRSNLAKTNIPDIEIQEYPFEKIQDGINNAFIGIKCINELCWEIPNFQYIYNVINNDGKITIFKETYKNYISFDKFIERFANKSSNDSSKEIIEVLIQIFLALQIAYENFGFEHGNLKPENIKIIEYDNSQLLRYNLSNKLFLLVTKYIAVIEDYSQSKCITDFCFTKNNNKENISNNKQKMSIGRWKNLDNKNNLPPDFEHYLLPVPVKDIITLKKKSSSKIGKNLKENLFIEDNKSDYYALMNKAVTPSLVRTNKVKFGPKESDESIANAAEESRGGNPRLIYDKVIGVKEPQIEIMNRMSNNQLPTSKTKAGNMVIKYEMTHALNTGLIDIRMNHNIDILTTSSLEKYIKVINNYYNDLINQIGDEFIDENSNKWDLRMFIRKYFLFIMSNKQFSKMIKNLTVIMKSSLKSFIENGIKNTINFVESLDIE